MFSFPLIAFCYPIMEIETLEYVQQLAIITRMVVPHDLNQVRLGQHDFVSLINTKLLSKTTGGPLNCLHHMLTIRVHQKGREHTYH